ncbi:hypothetical protein PL71_07765 [Pseudoalteromonas distincta]|uniref:Orphan protein n=1 Tax=Pseudoalteromonas distincta TaxID=77608 RepID=A0ABT9GEU5_9GAMM|nr:MULTISPECIES: hypothetical protein [Pseudoalteromonas distincta group]KHM49586.1 hypothetical protein PL71_07765 [Pseudoalteromonas elyakovii]KID38697.1 hypothetical protein QT16_09275 [Pseudoalteromonas distincta]MDP4484401.1 hypothetical protein [Pseudoalteromonas elyakovii]
MKFTLLKTIALGSLLTCSAAAMANQGDYKLMVIEDSVTAAPAFEKSFNSCAINVEARNYEEAEAICTQAIALLKQSHGPRLKVRELTSFALSNRGVARIKAQKDTAGISDLYEAVQISKNSLVTHNLTRAKKELSL